MYSQRRKGGPESVVELSPVSQGDKTFEENPDVKWNKGSDDLRARPHPAQLLTSGKEF